MDKAPLPAAPASSNWRSGAGQEDLGTSPALTFPATLDGPAVVSMPAGSRRVGPSNEAAAVMSHWVEDGPFHPQVNGLLTQAFGQELKGLSVSRNEASKNDALAAKAHTVGQRISLGAGIKEDPNDPESMEVISHEVAHALAKSGPASDLVDRPGDSGEHGAHAAGRSLRSYLEGGRQGPMPRLKPAHGGQAVIQRWGYIDHPVITDESLVQAGVLTKEEVPPTPTKIFRYLPPPLTKVGDYEYGSQWNDDLGDRGQAAAEFAGKDHPYGNQYKNGTRFGPGNPLLPRSHYGDLSFLHGMASPSIRKDENGKYVDKDKDGKPLPPESPQETQNKMVNWAKFTFAIQQGKIVTPDGKEVAIDGTTKLSNYPEFQKIFGDDPKLGEQTINQMFGNVDGKRDIKRVAMGSLAHMIEDSFATGHVKRDEQGRVLQFHSYGGQDPAKHETADDYAQAPAALKKMTVDETATIMKLAHGPKANFADIEARLRQKTLALAPNAESAAPGKEFLPESQPQPVPPILNLPNLKPRLPPALPMSPKPEEAPSFQFFKKMLAPDSRHGS